MFFDAALLCQFVYYGKMAKEEARRPLIGDDSLWSVRPTESHEVIGKSDKFCQSH
jgi:hypothetical protein